MSAERLAQALYGDEAQRHAVKTVQVHVSRLRKALGDPVCAPCGGRLGGQLKVRRGGCSPLAVR
jgi:DNA-binding SARP family transcriptional activator